ncbi:Acyl-CoA dehydrogenase family member 11 [Orchesella cincta]|uniref:Acyl-CoA dehydrogenase family member 11 n=1 Tax=Orchesella cincta TaxID=48709 RepID=A0A1D2N9C3_ORCCI|nr:Acyl-CoA dehydrogenase family member 11 [Orchesella cincta]
MSVTQSSLAKLFSGVVSFLNEKYSENCYSIKSFSIDTPCSAEDNFLSEIFAIKLNVKRKEPLNCKDAGVETQELIGKAQIIDDTEDVRRYVFNLIFTKEMLIYTDIFQRMEKLYTQAGISSSSSLALAPKLHHYYTEGESYSCLFMDNLVSQGYYIPTTHGTGIQLDECSSVMRAIAKFHAMSLVIEGEDQIPLTEKYEICTAEFFLSEATASTMQPLVLGSYAGIIQLAEKYRPDLVPLLESYDQEESIFDRLCKLVKPGTSSFSCLCHGDARLNNIFIKRDDISNVRFIDFQLTRYASPLTDLQYILNVGATKEFRAQYTEQMLRTYFEEFTLVLNSFPSLNLLPTQEAAVRGWTMEKVKEEYEGMAPYGFLVSLVLLPIILLLPGDIDKSVGQMSKAERETFWNAGRKQMVFELGCKHPDVRERLFDICDEAFAVINKKKA